MLARPDGSRHVTANGGNSNSPGTVWLIKDGRKSEVDRGVKFATGLKTTLVALSLPILLGRRGRGGSSQYRVFLADDPRWRDTTPYGSTFYQTAKLERLARRGMRFTQAYAANPLCSPTRSSIMTGFFPARTGIMTPSCHVEEVKLQAPLEKATPPGRR